MNKCRYCGTEGIIREIGGLFYAQCPGCDKHIRVDNDQYQYVGITKRGCAEVWNINNPEKGKYKSTAYSRQTKSNIM